jgi:L-asparaginase / beta-aspartyl-peptidase
MLLWKIFLALTLAVSAVAADTASHVVLAIHGGTADHKKIPPEKEKLYHASLVAALKAGQDALKAKGSSLDAVEAASRTIPSSTPERARSSRKKVRTSSRPPSWKGRR